MRMRLHLRFTTSPFLGYFAVRTTMGMLAGQGIEQLRRSGWGSYCFSMVYRMGAG